MVIARGGNVTGRDGKALRREELQRIVRAYLAMEVENSRVTAYFNREKYKNGVFASIDTTERQSIPQIVDQLVRCCEFEKSLQHFFTDVGALLESGDFVDDYSTIAYEAPELSESFIHKSFVHVGERLRKRI